MGVFRVPIEVGDRSESRWEPMEAVVDCGSTFTWVPRSMLESLGISATERADFDTAGGAVIQRDIGDAPIRLMGATHMNPVVFGDEDTPALLGAVTLEIFRLAVDPVHERLIPVHAVAFGPYLR